MEIIEPKELNYTDAVQKTIHTQLIYMCIYINKYVHVSTTLYIYVLYIDVHTSIHNTNLLIPV